jgi:hypothetical protein
MAKGLMNPLERFYIQSHYHHNILIPEHNTVARNPMNQLLFDLHITSRQKVT